VLQGFNTNLLQCRLYGPEEAFSADLEYFSGKKKGPFYGAFKTYKNIFSLQRTFNHPLTEPWRSSLFNRTNKVS